MNQDSWGEVILDDMAFPLAQPMEFQDLTRFQGRVIFGAPDLTSNPLLSTWVISDLMGGHGVDKLKEGTDGNRYRFSSLYCRIPSQMALPRYPRAVSGPNTTRACPLGDLYESGTYKFYADYGGKLVLWNEGTLSMGSSLGDLAGATVNKAVEFKGTGTRMLFIPAGANGYSTWDGSNLNTESTPLAQAFTLWDNKLICLDTDGQLHWTTDGTTWTGGTSGDSYGVPGKLDASYIPINLVVYYDRSDNPCIHVVTNRGVWSFDPAGPRLYLTDAQWPAHPYQGLGSDKWRGTMYVSNGMGITQFNGNLVNPGMGLDRDDGLPSAVDFTVDGQAIDDIDDIDNLRGYIIDLQQEYNGLYALVVGKASGNNSFTSVHVFTGFGWHCEYISETATAESKVTWMQVSQGAGGYRLWWGENGGLRTIKLPVDFANPRELGTASDGEFDVSRAHFFLSGRFDAEMQNYLKVGNTLEVRLSEEIAESVRVFYRRNDDLIWDEFTYPVDNMGNPRTKLENPGTYSLQMGTALDDDVGTSGVSFYEIEIMPVVKGIDAGSGVDDASPIIDYMALTYRQLVPSGYSWSGVIDLQKPHRNSSPETMRQKLDDLIDYAGFFRMTYQGKHYRVCMAQQTGTDESGHDTRGSRRINILEVPKTGIASGPSIAG
jgi:hypothetical protein